MQSKKDSRGIWCIDCAECQRGGNGDQSCSAGWQHKKTQRGSCFNGELLEKHKSEVKVE